MINYKKIGKRGIIEYLLLYQVQLISEDGNGNVNEAELTIEFLTEDLLPPKFEHDFYYSSISDPNFGTEKILDIQPKPILAQDGDTEINSTVVYSFKTQVRLKKSFDVSLVFLALVKNLKKACSKIYILLHKSGSKLSKII